jgi:hypothetical protein
LFDKLSSKEKKTLAKLQEGFCLRLMKKLQHQHKGKPYTQETFQDVEISVADASSKHVYVPEEPGEIHAHEAAGCHQEGGESHQVLAIGLTYYGPF